MNEKELIGLRLKELRKRLMISQEQLAEKAETNPNYVSRMERGTENPTLDMLIKISAALEVEMWELFDRPSDLFGTEPSVWFCFLKNRFVNFQLLFKSSSISKDRSFSWAFTLTSRSFSRSLSFRVALTAAFALVAILNCSATILSRRRSFLTTNGTCPSEYRLYAN
jgi:DNA-binding XRE family transcriptional regulator